MELRLTVTSCDYAYIMVHFQAVPILSEGKWFRFSAGQGLCLQVAVQLAACRFTTLIGLILGNISLVLFDGVCKAAAKIES